MYNRQKYCRLIHNKQYSILQTYQNYQKDTINLIMTPKCLYYVIDVRFMKKSLLRRHSILTIFEYLHLWRQHLDQILYMHPTCLSDHFDMSEAYVVIGEFGVHELMSWILKDLFRTQNFRTAPAPSGPEPHPHLNLSAVLKVRFWKVRMRYRNPKFGFWVWFWKERVRVRFKNQNFGFWVRIWKVRVRVRFWKMRCGCGFEIKNMVLVRFWSPENSHEKNWINHVII